MEICYLTGERAGSYLYEKADGEPVRDGRVVLGVGRVKFWLKDTTLVELCASCPGLVESGKIGTKTCGYLCLDIEVKTTILKSRASS